MILRPWWQRAAGFTVWGVFCWTIFQLFDSDAYGSRWIGVGFNSVATGLIFAAATQRLHRDVTEAVAGLDPSDRRSAVKAVSRGPIPEPLPVRAAALRVGRIFLHQNDFRRKIVLGTYVFFALLLIGCATFAVDQLLNGHLHYAGGYGLVALMLAILLASILNQQLRLRRRVDMLLASAPTAVTRAEPS
jgi:hypothetical protein